MAHQAAAVLVVGERHVTVLALGHTAAFLAAHHGRISASVLEQDHLLAVFQRPAAVVNEFIAEKPVHFASFAGVKRVDDLDIGHLDVAVARQQFHQSVFPFKCIVIDLNSRCCRA